MSGDLLAGRFPVLTRRDPRIRVDSRGTQGALEVVERRNKLPSQPRLAAALGLLRLACGALAVVLEVGAGALGDFQVLVALTPDVRE